MRTATATIESIDTRYRTFSAKKFRAYTLGNINELPDFRRLPETVRRSVRIAGNVLPFKTNNYITDELIDWDQAPNDPMFLLTFPQRKMLLPTHFERMEEAFSTCESLSAVKQTANEIRLELNPNPAGQKSQNVPRLDGEIVEGCQHKYKETVLFFPREGQTCHAHCTFCFRWPQFTGLKELRFAAKEAERLVEYLRRHEEVTDVLITGGDPLFMSTDNLERTIQTILDADIPHVQSIRIGTKVLAFWPYRFLTDPDSEQLLELFSRVNDSGKQLAFMANFSHPRELETDAVEEAVYRILRTGTQIRTQCPILRNINDDPQIWAKMWRKQVRMGCIPYYMFVARDTGAQHYFRVPLSNAWQIFHEAYKQVSGLARTVRGPVMSTTRGKIQVLGKTSSEDNAREKFVMQFLQSREPDWVTRPFFVDFDPELSWINEDVLRKANPDFMDFTE